MVAVSNEISTTLEQSIGISTICYLTLSVMCLFGGFHIVVFCTGVDLFGISIGGCDITTRLIVAMPPTLS